MRSAAHVSSGLSALFEITVGLTVGRIPLSPIWPEAKPPFEYEGSIEKVVVDVSGDHLVSDEHLMRIAMAVQ